MEGYICYSTVQSYNRGTFDIHSRVDKLIVFPPLERPAVLFFLGSEGGILLGEAVPFSAGSFGGRTIRGEFY